jgi:benzil reductase ((S)-benzoin forming)
MNLYIVTGSTRGLGKALCEEIARSPGNELIALGRAPDAPVPGGARLEVDLSDTAATERVCDRIEQRIRGKRYEKAVLVNNAGIVEPVAPLEQVPADDLERNLVVNLVAPLLLMRRFLIATEGVALLQRIINISSGAGRRPISGWAAYCASKAGLDMATRVVALEAESRRRPVEAVSLAPGVIDTDMQQTVRSVPRGPLRRRRALPQDEGGGPAAHAGSGGGGHPARRIGRTAEGRRGAGSAVARLTLPRE